MFIRNVHVRHFRSILDESLPCDRLTALVGRNGSGKSSFLSALELFYDPSARVTMEDFYAEDTSSEIEIAVTYTKLNPQARELFAPYMENDRLTIVRIFKDPQIGKSGTYHGMRLQHPEFRVVRNAANATAVRKHYDEIRARTKYAALPRVGSAAKVLEELEHWEKRNPDQCSRLKDDGQFFGFTQVGQGYLGQHTKFIPVPAVRDALEDATEKKGSSVTEIMDLVVRNALAKRSELTEFKQQTRDRHREIMDPQKLQELRELQDRLSNTLKSYVPEASVQLQWLDVTDIEIPMPKTQVKLLEDEYESTVERTGHGLQRAFIVTMLQHLAAVREAENTAKQQNGEEGDNKESGTQPLPNLILAIEEPELYQHPSRQRHLASVLMKLATHAIAGVAQNTQVIYATHSPLFVDVDRFDQIRVLRKERSQENEPKITRLKQAEMTAVADKLCHVTQGKPKEYTPQTLRPRLRAIMTPWMNEGFFADVVVLVEGESDRAAILGIARSMQVDFDSQGITVIPCFGKSNLDRPALIFRQLGIPVYVVWDGDKDPQNANSRENRILQRLHNLPEEDWPGFIRENCACFEERLENTLENEIGKELLEHLIREVQQQLEIDKKNEAMKNVEVIQRIIKKAATKGRVSNSLMQIVRKIVALKTHSE